MKQRYLRLTMKMPEGTKKITAMWQLRSDGLLIGKSKTGPLGKTTLNVALASPEDVLSVEKIDHHYDEWTNGTAEDLPQ